MNPYRELAKNNENTPKKNFIERYYKLLWFYHLYVFSLTLLVCGVSNIVIDHYCVDVIDYSYRFLSIGITAYIAVISLVTVCRDSDKWIQERRKSL